MTPDTQAKEALLAGAAEAGRRAARRLFGMRDPQGFWNLGLQSDVTIEADYILLQLWLHPPAAGIWNPPDPERTGRAVRSILARELGDGGWSIFPGAPADLNATVKAYSALRVAGLAAEHDALVRARERVLSLGGVERASSMVKIHLSLFGLYPREHCPAVPPELLMLPGRLLYRMGWWARAIAAPLAILQSQHAARPVPEGVTLGELFALGEPLSGIGDDGCQGGLAGAAARLFRFWARHGGKSTRRRALEACTAWVAERVEAEAVGATFPSILYATMALKAARHPGRALAERQLERLVAGDGERLSVKAACSPVRDTALAAFALARAGEGQALAKSDEWLLRKEARRRGDWSVMRPGLPPSGWHFGGCGREPGVDDTAMVLLATASADSPEWRKARERAVAWLLGMQSAGGGWAAFDGGRNRLVGRTGFAGPEAVLDEPCPDVTGRVLDASCSAGGVAAAHPSVRRGVAFLLRSQEADGSWRGRWGVNYIYGTYLALRGLQAAGVSDREAAVLRAGEWLRSIQNPGGGWGESCAGYENRAFTPAPSTPSQTAWAVLGLLAGGDSTSMSVQSGIEYLIASERGDGGWDEELPTATGIPGAFFLSHAMYRYAFPLLALSAYGAAAGQEDRAQAETLGIRNLP